MIEKKNQNNPLNRCKFCGWKFPNDLLEKINENSDPLFCELCGAEIRYYYINNQENDEIIKNKNEIYLCGSTDKSKSSLWKRIYDIIKKFIIETGRIKIQKGLTEKQKESITRVFNDNDFPKIFKENFIIVFARITYFELKKLESTANLKNSRRNLTEAELKTLNEHLNPITKKDIKAEFLKNLHKISQNDFRKWLKKLQVKLKLSPTYYNDFITYIQWLIKTIATIISEMWDKTNLPKFEQTILKDLKNYFYSFYFTKNNIKNEPEDQKLRRLKETTYDGISLDEDTSRNPNWKTYIKENIDLIRELNENDKELISKVINKVDISEEERKKLISILSKLDIEQLIEIFGESFKHNTKNFVKWGWDYNMGVKKLMLNKYFNIMQKEVKHYNRWLTDKIQNYIKNIDNEIKFLFEHFESFSKMDRLFGLGSNYICGQRMEKNSKKIIAVNILDRMRLSLKKNIQNLIINYPHLSDLLMDTQKGILDFIDEYENKLSPKPSSRYQMYHHHPNFIRDFFKVINTKEKAYWLGFLFADAWIARELKDSGYYYRMGFGLSTNDKAILVRFCNAVGLNLENIEDRLTGSAFSNEKYPMSVIRWGDQEFAQHLINLGIEYVYNQEKGRRVKNPKLPILRDRELMLAFSLGFYDGDGTLGYNKFTKRIQPSLASSNKDFLLQIKNYFDIKNKISSRVIEKYNIRKNKMVKTHANALNINVKLFEEMLKNYKNSMERKKVDLEFFEGYYEPKAKKPTPQRVWLRKKLPKRILKEIIKVLSPNKIAKLLGVHRSTIMNLSDEYNIYFFDGGYYLSIDRFIRYQDKDSEFYEPYHRWLDYLKKIGKFSNQ